jgi:histidinol-phosphate aminotransferase
MNTNLNRRNWIKSSLALTAGLVATSSLTEKLMAAPMSRAEKMMLPKTSSLLNGAVRLNSNENPYGPPEKAKAALLQLLSEGNRYPFAAMDEFKKMLAAKEGVAPEYIHLGAGSGELLCQAGVAFGLEGKSVMSSYPTFPMLMTYAESMKATWQKIDLNDALEHDYQAMASGITSDTKLIFVCNPNNPTGTLVDQMVVERFCEEASKKATIYADEAYLEFLEPSQQRSMVGLVKQGKNVIVSRTFSKIFGLAGLRVGYIVAHPDMIKRLAKFNDDFSISQTSLAAAKACVGDEDFMKLTRTKNAVARKVLTDYLDEKKIMYGKSVTNFVFFPAPKDGKTILTTIEQKGFLMRIWDYKNREWCRVSIGTQDEMMRFVKAFDEIA